jgi:YD repeat-containing protein
VTTYQYDAIGNSTTTAVPGPGSMTTTTTYDALNRQVEETDPLGHITTFVYDADSNRIQSPTTTTFIYDATGSMTDPLGNITTYVYDADYDVLQSPNVTTYIYDVMDSITAPGGSITTYTYDYQGTLLPNGIGPDGPDFLYDYSDSFSNGGSLNETDNANGDFNSAPLPEPTSLGVLGILGALSTRRMRRRVRRSG